MSYREKQCRPQFFICKLQPNTGCSSCSSRFGLNDKELSIFFSEFWLKKKNRSRWFLSVSFYYLIKYVQAAAVVPSVKAFASHEEGGCSNPSRDRSKSLKQVVTVPLPNPRVLGDNHYKPCPVSQYVWHAKEPSLLNAHKCRV